MAEKHKSLKRINTLKEFYRLTLIRAGFEYNKPHHAFLMLQVSLILDRCEHALGKRRPFPIPKYC